MRQAAKVFGVSVWVIYGVKLASKGEDSPPFSGRYTTAERLDRWFDDHPDFVASHHIRQQIQKNREEKSSRERQRRRRAA